MANPCIGGVHDSQSSLQLQGLSGRGSPFLGEYIGNIWFFVPEVVEILKATKQNLLLCTRPIQRKWALIYSQRHWPRESQKLRIILRMTSPFSMSHLPRMLKEMTNDKLCRIYTVSCILRNRCTGGRS